ncbi:PRC-barrel domain-containing protein [Paucibacter sp. APW11]|uniref:PRC-barrel domain-containing protein n=1 Tax=Roseateles aquae TaxID=3077235 RepID=A0ABU3P5A8_9BURK|nr:PRC-barrel domain-containing protein [Paucibacter sp. APW11]MDT8997761.1 PRC-barrel domain-containing protein [Paucibacter sp. APW11]
MLNSVSHLSGSSVHASDGEIGQVSEVFFDDHSWAIRYLVINTGSWLAERKVLISPYAVRQPLGETRSIRVNLTKQQLRDSPDVDTHQPVSRRHERELLGFYQYPEYWAGGGLWGLGLTPYGPMMPLSEAELAANRAMLERDFKPADVHLRSSTQVIGYHIEAAHESIGQVEDFIFDDYNWAIRYLILDTNSWWPGGRKVLIGLHWVDKIEWATRRLHVNLTRNQVKASPVYQGLDQLHRDYETRLHQSYKRQGYWD